MKKGFTLVELLAVIIILGVIVGIAFPVVNKTIKNSKNKALEETKENILQAANKYSISNDLGFSSTEQKIDLEELKEAGLIENKVINPVDKKELNGCVVYKWVEEYKQYEFRYEEPCKVHSLIELLLEKSTYGLTQDINNPNRYYYKGNDSSGNTIKNFLWYGGHQWRVLEFDKEKDTIKLITQQPLTAIHPAKTLWTTSSMYNGSYIDNWLNEYFYQNLNQNIKNNIKEINFNIGIYTNPSELLINKKVGLLDYNEYLEKGGKESFLNIHDSWFLGNRWDNNTIVSVTFDDWHASSVDWVQGVRPVVTISNVFINEGEGTLENNYKLTEKMHISNEMQIGDYIKINYKGNECGSDNKCMFRVVNKDEDSVKLILNGLLPNLSAWSSTPNQINPLTTDYLIYQPLKQFVNNFNKNYIVDQKPFGNGYYSFSTMDYKNTQNPAIISNVGLPTIGEMFSGNDIDMDIYEKHFVDKQIIENPNVGNSYWTTSLSGGLNADFIAANGIVDYAELSINKGVRPTIYIKNNLNLVSGDGSPNSPYELE